MKLVVLDTSVVIAGSLSSAGAAAALLEAFYHDRLALAYTGAILAEYMEIMSRPKFAGAISLQARHSLALKLNASGTTVTPAPVPAADWPDPDDLPFVAAALATECKILVTLNPRDFVPAAPLGVRVLSPSEARRLLL